MEMLYGPCKDVIYVCIGMLYCRPYCIETLYRTVQGWHIGMYKGAI